MSAARAQGGRKWTAPQPAGGAAPPIRRWSGLGVVCLLAACAPATRPPGEPVSAILQDEAVGPVTDEMLRIGHVGQPELWPTYGGDWGQTRYSALDQIRRENVHRLRPAWIYQTGILGTFSNTPIVLGREMYVTTPAEEGRQEVIRLDATTGEVVWRVEILRREVDRPEAEAVGDQHLPANFGPHRGVAVYGDRLYLGTLNGTLLALDRETGETAFDVPSLAPQITGAPLAAEGRIILGLSWVSRGAVQAFDAGTGDHLWTWRSIEEESWWGEWTEHLPGRPDIDLGRDIAQERADSARFADAWKAAGGSAPMTPSFDAELGLVYVATGGPDPTAFPEPAEPYPGDLRWTNSVCALRIEDGVPAWCFQFLPRDIWGASGPTPPILFDHVENGNRVPAIGRFSGMGIFHVWDRRDGRLIRVSDNYIPVEQTLGGGTGATLIRGGMAGTVWSPGAYSPQTGLFYSTNQRVPGYFEPRDAERSGEAFGNVAAVDPATGRVAWTHRLDRPMAGGALATAGGLVFAGRTTGSLDAYDAATGERVWTFRTGAGCNSAPITYQVQGVQYVAVACGGHGVLDPASGNALVTFALPPL